jgi:hypothetical protein
LHDRHHEKFVSLHGSIYEIQLRHELLVLMMPFFVVVLLLIDGVG